MKLRSLLSVALIAIVSMLLTPAAFAETTPPASSPIAAAAAVTGAASSTAPAPADAPTAQPPAAPPTRKTKLVKARVLTDSQYGKANAVVELEEAAVKAGVAAGELDPDKAAVAYAESLA